MNRCHSVARTCTDFAENPMVDMSDIPKYSCAGVHIWAGFFRFIWVTYMCLYNRWIFFYKSLTLQWYKEVSDIYYITY
jgi:hypothetical protein